MRLIHSAAWQPLGCYPDFDCSQASNGRTRCLPRYALCARPKLSAPQASVHREERFIPALGDAPDIRVLIYSPLATVQAAAGRLFFTCMAGYIRAAPEINEVYNRSFCVRAWSSRSTIAWLRIPDIRDHSRNATPRSNGPADRLMSSGSIVPASRSEAKAQTAGMLPR